MKSLSSTAEKYAEMALLAGDLLAAEGILLQNGLIKEAIHINLEVYNWNRYIKYPNKTKIWLINFWWHRLEVTYTIEPRIVYTMV